jgi:hypothetical protein
MANFVIDKNNKEMFEVFCRIHPHEAFGLNKNAFLKYMRKEGYDINEKGVIKLLKSTL